jgi:DNA end-binding protein Ku
MKSGPKRNGSVFEYRVSGDVLMAIANTVWKGQLTFGLISFPVRLVGAARKDRIPLRYIREVEPPESQEGATNSPSPPSRTREWTYPEEDESRLVVDRPAATLVAPVRQAYVADDEDKSMAARELQRGYEVAPGQFAVVRSEELQQLRQPTSAAMEILRSVRMDEIDPVFLETSYYVVPGNGGEHSYGLSIVR